MTLSAPEELTAAYDRWLAAAAAVVAKGRRTEVADLPAAADELLTTATADVDVAIRPLYTRRDELAEPGLPGAAPFTRGADPLRDVHMGWRVTERYGDTTAGAADATQVNAEILTSLGAGGSGIWLAVGEGALDPAAIADTLREVYTDLVPITLDAGSVGITAATALLKVVSTDTERPLATGINLGFAPLTSAFSGRPAVSLAETVQQAAAASPGIRAIRIDGTDFAQAGASDAVEIALVTAAGIDYLRALQDAGLDARKALAQIGFALSVDDNQFGVIAKLRAARTVWGRVAEVAGAPDAGAAPTHAVTNLAMFSQRDPWVNLLRSTVAAFGAGVGGADQVTVFPYDHVLAAADQTAARSFSRRMARNTQLLLLEESNLGRVLDPAGGAWFVESLTADLAAAAWGVVQRLEGAGGYRQALAAGLVAEIVDTARSARDRQVASRKKPLTGVSEFPNLAEPALTGTVDAAAAAPTATAQLARTAAGFEALRDRSDAFLAAHGRRPTITLIPLGAVAEHNARTTFIANLLAAGGISATNNGPADLSALTLDSDIVVICGSNDRYASDGAAAVEAARSAGAARVLVAGPQKAWPATVSADGYLAAGIDAIAALIDLLDALEA